MVNRRDAHRRFRCVSCAHEFRMDSSVDQRGPAPAGPAFAIRCQACDRMFGISPEMAGQTVACPVCKSRQQVREYKEPEPPPFAAPLELESARESRRQPKKQTPAGRQAAAGRPSPMPNREWSEVELLPPRYCVPAEIEEQVARESVDSGRSQFDPDINPDLLRIQAGGQAVLVNPLSREIRDRRKRLRVAIVFVAGMLILIAVFGLLMAWTG